MGSVRSYQARTRIDSIVLYDDDNAPQTQGVGHMLSNVLNSWEPDIAKFFSAKFKTKHRNKLDVVQCFASINDAEEESQDQQLSCTTTDS